MNSGSGSAMPAALLKASCSTSSSRAGRADRRGSPGGSGLELQRNHNNTPGVEEVRMASRWACAQRRKQAASLQPWLRARGAVQVLQHVAWQGPPTCTGTGFAGLEARKWRPAQHQAGSPHWAAGGSERGSVLNTPPQCTRPAFKRPCPRVVQEPAPTLQITAGAHLSFRVLSWRMPRSEPAAPADSRQRPPGPAGLGGPTPSISRLLPQRRRATASSNSKLTPLQGRPSMH